MMIFIAGLPRSGKSSLADALEALGRDYTHVPLDKYILEVPADRSFLQWVASPQCIDWPLLQAHLQRLAENQPCYTPAPDWQNRGHRRSAGGDAPGGRLMHPATRAYLLPGTYAFHFPSPPANSYRLFVRTPHAIIAERLLGHPVPEAEIADILDARLSANWHELEAQSATAAHFVISGVETRERQVERFLEGVR